MELSQKHTDQLQQREAEINLSVLNELQEELTLKESLKLLLEWLVSHFKTTEEKYRDNWHISFGGIKLEVDFQEVWAHEKMGPYTEKQAIYYLYSHNKLVDKIEGMPESIPAASKTHFINLESHHASILREIYKDVLPFLMKAIQNL